MSMNFSTSSLNNRVLKSEEFRLGKNQGYNFGLLKPMGNLAVNGQNGLSPDLRYIVANSSYVNRNLVCVLLAAPRFFEFLPNPQYYIATLKSMFETWAEKWEGLKSTKTVEFAETIVGATEMQFDPSRVVRETSTPTMTISEKYGMAVNRFLDTWIEYGIGSPETFIPAVMTLGNNAYTEFHYLPDYLGATALFYEPTPEGTHVQKAFLVTGMMPKTSGEVTGTRDQRNGGNKSEYSIEFTATQQVGDGVMYFAEKVHRTLALTGLNPGLRRAFWGDDDKTINTLIQAGGLAQTVQSRVGADDRVGFFGQTSSVATNERYEGAPVVSAPNQNFINGRNW